LNRRPLPCQGNALPLSYAPIVRVRMLIQPCLHCQGNAMAEGRSFPTAFSRKRPPSLLLHGCKKRRELLDRGACSSFPAENFGILGGRNLSTIRRCVGLRPILSLPLRNRKCAEVDQGHSLPFLQRRRDGSGEGFQRCSRCDLRNACALLPSSRSALPSSLHASVSGWQP
jgi:hypothetical protein